MVFNSCAEGNIITFENLIAAQKSENVLDEDEGKPELNKREVKIEIPNGVCKSGRFWKTPKTRAKTIVKTRGLQLTLEKRKKMQEEIKIAKQLTRDALNERKKQKEEHRERRVANLKKREENEKKAEIVQVIKNPSKIKKKHLRMIEKRDTLPFLNKTVY